MSFRNLMYAIWLCLLLAVNVCDAGRSHKKHKTKQHSYALTLDQQYTKHCTEWSDIHEHLPVLRQLSSECSSVIEIGVRSVVSTWGILMGLMDSPHQPKTYLGIDLNDPPEDKFRLAQALAEQNQISFKFWKGNDLDAEVEPADLIFIDTLHIYCQLTVELEKFAPKAKKYIVMHDTSGPWGDQDEDIYHGDRSEYPEYVDKTKRGLWPAVEDFLARHPEWQLKERRTNNNGLTTLVRVR